MLALSLPQARAAASIVRYPRSESLASATEHYPVRLLRMALARSGRDYALQSTPLMMRQSRALLELQSGRVLDVMWTMTSRERERDLLPIRIPIDRGLIGWRLLLIRKADVARFAAIRRIEELRALTALQGHDWPDTEILRANQFNVQTASDYAGMFGMLATERVDYFPRATFEIWDEAKLHAREGLVVAPGLALYYPSAFYYFVNKANVKLAADIERGMQQMLADGSYDKLFDEYFGVMVERAALAKRKVFDLRNPLLPDATPLARRELWYRPR
jgi:ABC-type amino acid transport substrate-binding protein